MMDSRIGERSLLNSLVVVVVVVGLVLVINGARADPQVPCYFIFGDSLVDNGNNNQLTSLAKANYLPYGIDFPGGPTGRFSNGKTTVDVIGKAPRPIPVEPRLSMSTPRLVLITVIIGSSNELTISLL